MNSTRHSISFLVAIAALLAITATPWLLSARLGPPVPADLVAQPTAYQIKRELRLTSTAQADTKTLPTVAPEATVFDLFAATPEAAAPTPTPTPEGNAMTVPTAEPAPTLEAKVAVFRNTAKAALKTSAALKHQPDGDAGVDISPEIAAGQAVVLLGKATDATGATWYRVVWPIETGQDYVGWLRAAATDFPADKLDVLRPPPTCAQFLAASAGPKSFINPKQQNIGVLADLYRLDAGTDYPEATFKVMVNGEVKEGASRLIRATRGQFLLGQGVAIAVGNVAADSEVSFFTETTSDEPLKLFTTIFAVPEGCAFGDN